VLNEPDLQGSLFPHATPETLLLQLRRLERRVLGISPELSKEQCLAVLRELALTDLAFDRIEVEIINSPVYKARQEWQASSLMDELKRSIAEQTTKRKRA
jgi:hypothetical protein